jgi:hypothetical protein
VSQFHLYDAVGSWWDWRAGHDTHGRAIFHRVIRYITGSYSSGYTQTRWLPALLATILAKQCEPIHSRIGERRHILLCYHILCQHKAKGCGEWYVGSREWLNLGKYTFKSFFYADHK